MASRAKWISLGGLLGTAVLVGVPHIPLGAPGEWQWPRHALPDSLPQCLDRLIGPVFACGILLLTSLAGHRLLTRARPGRQLLLAGLLLICSLVGSAAIRTAAPAPFRDLRELWVLYDPSSSGYFFEAAFHVSSASELLSGYEARMEQGDVLHEGTHPPGLYLLSHGALRLTEASPTLAALVRSTVSDASERGFRELETAASMAPRLNDSQLAALAMLVNLTRLLQCLTPVFVFGLSLLLVSPIQAWRAGCLTITIPALQVFFPKSDVAFGATSALFLWLSIAGLFSPGRARQLITSAIAAVTLFAGLLLSLAHLPALMVYLLCAALLLTLPERRPRRDVLLCLAAFSATLMVCIVCWSLLTDCPILRIWQWNLSNHAGFYDQYPRTAWKWLLVNPVELVIATGAPLGVLAAISGARCLRQAVQAVRSGGADAAPLIVAGSAMVLTVMALWVSGRNSGEAARLWCFLMPWLAVLAAAESEFGEPDSGALSWKWLLGCQALCTVLVVGRVSGFLQL